jgi:Na+-transporting NADH:ubiquinone oxidoreductase subunit NqrF
MKNFDELLSSIYGPNGGLAQKNPNAVLLGQLGGMGIAKRGSDYFRKLQQKRRNRRGRYSK